MVSKILLGYEEALWPKKLEISHASQFLTNERQIWFFLSYLITTVAEYKKFINWPPAQSPILFHTMRRDLLNNVLRFWAGIFLLNI